MEGLGKTVVNKAAYLTAARKEAKKEEGVDSKITFKTPVT